ncbi:MAG: exonuclease subunit SbcD [Oscillatoriales cyanobacterium RM2_1_1]|nr:exonuclease subunit SbcD [Oscillatoriales cyanobacterium SM2_3_0]NJO45267.1 exonuclease subunit SbcD [Oscillatoriales cyanobacterium RM2_1_1]
MIKILHLSDIHIGSGFSHGRTNPETGCNTRLEDFQVTLGRCIDRAIAEPVDLVLFGGDAFPDATPPPLIKEAFATQFRRLVEAQIPTVLLVGNHDQYSQGQGGASLGIYRTLGIPGFVVGDRLETHLIQTRPGAIQVITLPWLTRSTLLTRPETAELSLESVNQLLIDKLKVALEGEIRRLDPALPVVLLAHVMVDKASLGAERFLAVGKGFTVPLSLLNRPCFDYVALGHVHKHQNLNPSNDPPVVYPGSIERVDFSEEKEDKGFVLIELEQDRVHWEFCPLSVRSFCTIKVDISKLDPPKCDPATPDSTQPDPSQARTPQAEILKAIATDQIQGAVVRLIYQLRPDQLDYIDTGKLYQALEPAHSFSIQPELVSQLARPRAPELKANSSLDPIESLKTYLKGREDLQDLELELVAAAQQLLAGEVPD